MTGWFVIRTREEFAARDRLGDAGWFTHVPAERVWRRQGRKFAAIERPVWRGYGFVLCERTELDAVLEASLAHSLVQARVDIRCGDLSWTMSRPVELPIDALDEIIAAEANGELDHAPEVWTPRVGEHVRVTSGKWRGYLGRVTAVAKRKTIMDLEDGFGRMTVSTDTLEPRIAA